MTRACTARWILHGTTITCTRTAGHSERHHFGTLNGYPMTWTDDDPDAHPDREPRRDDPRFTTMALDTVEMIDEAMRAPSLAEAVAELQAARDDFAAGMSQVKRLLNEEREQSRAEWERLRAFAAYQSAHREAAEERARRAEEESDATLDAVGEVIADLWESASTVGESLGPLADQVVAERNAAINMREQRDLMAAEDERLRGMSRDALQLIDNLNDEAGRREYRISTLMAINEGQQHTIDVLQKQIEIQRTELSLSKASVDLHAALLRDAS